MKRRAKAWNSASRLNKTAFLILQNPSGLGVRSHHLCGFVRWICRVARRAGATAQLTLLMSRLRSAGRISTFQQLRCGRLGNGRWQRRNKGLPHAEKNRPMNSAILGDSHVKMVDPLRKGANLPKKHPIQCVGLGHLAFSNTLGQM